MAIEVEWQDESGKMLARYDGPPIDRRVWSHFPASGACLRFVDPYGDTVFNQAQIEALAMELNSLLAERPADLALPALRQFVERAIGKVHTYLKFIGD